MGNRGIWEIPNLDKAMGTAKVSLQDIESVTGIRVEHLEKLLENHGNYWFKHRTVAKVEEFFSKRNVFVEKNRRPFV